MRALDDRTLEYRFTRPAPYFLVQASNWSAIPLRQELVEAGGPEWWVNPATRIGNGPFRLVTYDTDEPDRRVIYARNERYWGGHTKLDGLEFLFLDIDPATEAYRNGEVDVIWPGELNIPAIEADPVLSRELVIIPDAGTDYFVFNLNREPFQDPKVREAFAYAFDRDAFCRRLALGGNCLLTLSMIPPGCAWFHRDRRLRLRSGESTPGAGGVLLRWTGESARDHLVWGEGQSGERASTPRGTTSSSARCSGWS